MRSASGKLPNQPGVYGASQEFASIDTLFYTGYVVDNQRSFVAL